MVDATENDAAKVDADVNDNPLNRRGDQYEFGRWIWK